MGRGEGGGQEEVLLLVFDIVVHLLSKVWGELFNLAVIQNESSELTQFCDAIVHAGRRRGREEEREEGERWEGGRRNGGGEGGGKGRRGRRREEERGRKGGGEGGRKGEEREEGRRREMEGKEIGGGMKRRGREKEKGMKRMSYLYTPPPASSHPTLTPPPASPIPPSNLLHHPSHPHTSSSITHPTLTYQPKGFVLKSRKISS